MRNDRLQELLDEMTQEDKDRIDNWAKTRYYFGLYRNGEITLDELQYTIEEIFKVWKEL